MKDLKLFIESNHIIKGENDHSFSFLLNKDHEVFKGHFPENPILPGVCQIEMVKAGLAKIVSKDLILKSASVIKYLNPINPILNNIVHLTINSIKRDGEIYTIDASIYFENTVFMKFKGSFEHFKKNYI